MLSKNKNPILLRIIHRIVENVKTNNIYGSILDITGPGAVGLETNIYLNRNEKFSFYDEEGIHNTLTNLKIKLLKFEEKTEYIRNIDNEILFQNKNGNTLIKKIYKKEIEEVRKKLGYQGWTNHINNRNNIITPTL